MQSLMIILLIVTTIGIAALSYYIGWEKGFDESNEIYKGHVDDVKKIYEDHIDELEKIYKGE